MSKSKPTEKIYVDGCVKRLELQIGDSLSSDRVSRFLEEARINGANVEFDVDFGFYDDSQSYLLVWEHPGHLETDEEFLMRVEEWEQDRKLRLNMEEIQKQVKEEDDRREYERLKKKFEKNT